MNVKWTTNDLKTVLTATWDTVTTAQGFSYWKDGTRISWTMDGARTSTRFGLDGKPHIFEVYALGKLDHATTAYPLPATPSPPASSDEWSRFVALRDAAVPAPLGAAAVRTRDFSVPSDALAAINAMQPGDSIRLAAGMTIPGRVILPKLSSVGEVLCNGAKFTGVDNSPALSQGRWDTIAAGHSANVRMYDGEVTAAANMGIRLYGDCPNIGFYRFKVHGTNGNGFEFQPIYGDVVDTDFTGEVWNCGVPWWVLAFDPHTEKGTGTHGGYLGGASSGKVLGPRIFVHVHDQPFGAAVEVNLVDHSPSRHAEIAVYGQRLTFAAGVDKTIGGLSFPAGKQVAGNVVQAWGSNGGCDFPLLYGEDLQGRVMDTNTPSPDSAYAGFKVGRARALRTNLNPLLSASEGNVPQGEPFDPRRGVVYADKARLA